MSVERSVSFAGIKTDLEAHLLSRSSFVEALNVDTSDYSINKRRGFTVIFRLTADEGGLLFPTCLSSLQTPSSRFESADCTLLSGFIASAPNTSAKHFTR